MKRSFHMKTAAALLACVLIAALAAPAALAAVDPSQQYTLILEEAQQGGNTVAVEQGDSFTLALTLTRTDVDPTTGAQALFGFQDEIQYSTEHLQLDEVEILAESFLDGYRNMSNGVDRKILIHRYAQSDGTSLIPLEFPAVTQLARLTFTALKAGQTEILQVNQKVMTGGADVYESTVNQVSVTIGGAPAPQQYTVTVTQPANGTIAVSPSGLVAAGTTITLTATPNSGYSLSAWSITPAPSSYLSGGSATLSAAFTMPEGNVAVTATMVPTNVNPGPGGGGGGGGGGAVTDNQIIINPDETPLATPDVARFDDVPKDHWAYIYVEYLAGLGFVNGKTASLFYPSDSITRGEFVTILARMSGEALPAVDGTFRDVDASMYYATPVAWAIQAGVTLGTSETTFSPNDTITREQIAAMIARYAAYRGYTFGVVSEKLDFTDSADISAYAAESVTAMQQANIIGGYEDGSFKPAGNATRAESAKMLALIHHAMFPDILLEG